MNFFEQQDQARKRTKWLVVMYLASVLLIAIAVNFCVLAIFKVGGTTQYYTDPLREPRRQVLPRLYQYGNEQIIIATTCIVLLIIGGGSAYKTMSLSGGGPSVAQLLGGRPLNPTGGDNKEAMLQNVVEEMAIASGVPVPRVYLLDQEPGINAFAAGFTTADAVIGVTRGAVEKLNRDELQGVIGHEFSHILNGDMRLNIRLIGLLNGILVVSLIGAGMMRVFQYSSFQRRRRDDSQGAVLAILLLGMGLYAIGSIGVFFGRLIQAAVSRQREFLADASAVQFTRNPAGLAGALKKLGAYSSGSRVENHHAMEAAHLFFANSTGMFFGDLLATHPPLIERIRRLDPTFDGHFERTGHSDLVKEYDGSRTALQPGDRRPLTGIQMLQEVGQVRAAHLQLAAGLIQSIPDPLSRNARDPFSARAVVMAMLIGDDPGVRDKQMSLIQRSVEPACYQLTQQLAPAVAALGEAGHLPLFDLCLPALRRLSPQQAAAFRGTCRALIEADGQVTLFEFALNRMLDKQLASPDQSRRAPIEFFAIAAVRDSATVLLSAMASASESETLRAFQLASLKLDPNNPPQFVQVNGLGEIEQSLSRLAKSSPAVKRRLMDAAACAIAADGEVSVAEAELLRAIAATLDVPMPVQT